MKKIFFILLVIAAKLAFSQTGIADLPLNDTTAKWHHLYHQTLVMKIMNCVVNDDGTAKVICNFEKTLSIIKKMDKLTLGVPKILYLVGWQYNGHDDKYPAFFKVNNALKRSQDIDGKESLNWLVREAKKYHTVISLHINMTDAYENSPLWKEYVANDLISKNADGSLMVIGNYNNRNAYQINYRNEWKKGFAQKRIDRLLDLLPWLKEAGTIHLDAWYARDSKGHGESADVEQGYQKKVARYWLQKGIDPTNEVVLSYLTGLVPWCYHFNYRTQDDYLNVPARILTGTHMNPDIHNSDFELQFLFGTSTYGEKSFPGEWSKVPDDKWEADFVKKFYLNFPQYYYLNRLERLSVKGEGHNRVAYFSDNVRVSLKDSSVFENYRQLRWGSTICFPALWRSDYSLVAYSAKDTSILCKLPETWKGVRKANTFAITERGLVRMAEISVNLKQVKLVLERRKPVLIQPVKEIDL